MMPNPRVAWIAQHESTSTTAADALAFFDSLPAFSADRMYGRWRGSDIKTGHAFNDLLPLYGWYGKHFVDSENVHPLLFRLRGRIVPVNVTPVPVRLLVRQAKLAHNAGLATVAKAFLPLLATRRATARLRMSQFRGVVTATMIYDAKPINDVFREVDDDTVFGLMDARFLREPYFFALHRDAAAPNVPAGPPLLKS